MVKVFGTCWSYIQKRSINTLGRRVASFVLITTACISIIQPIGVLADNSSTAIQAPASSDLFDIYNNSPNYVGTYQCSDSGASTTLTGNGNEQQAYNYFVSVGLSPQQSASLVGNFAVESGVNPTETNSIGAHGIAQWYQGRVTRLIQYAQSHGIPEDSLATQLAFAWWELNNDYPTVLGQLKATNDVDTGTYIIFQYYEHPGDNSLPKRKADAEQILKQYGGGAVSITPSSSTTQDNNCSTTPPSNSTAYSNPLRDVQDLVPERIDEGVDYSGTGPVYAIGNGQVLNVYNSGWPNNTFIVYRLSDGPAAGKLVYFAECVTPSVTVGEIVNSTTVIGQMINCGSGIETGWASTTIGISMANQYNQFDNTDSTAFGLNYSQLLQSVNAPPGIVKGTVKGTLPDGWPTW